jgi:CheY-like chemotaxis protein
MARLKEIPHTALFRIGTPRLELNRFPAENTLPDGKTFIARPGFALAVMGLFMPNLSGFDPCRTLSSYSKTQSIPIFVVSGETGERTKEYCQGIGAAGYFEKPIDFGTLNERLAKVRSQALIPRTEVHVQLRVPLMLKGIDNQGNPFQDKTMTENVSMSGFFCGYTATLQIDSVVDVLLIGGREQYVGKARTVRCEQASTLGMRYDFRFTQNSSKWILE